MDCYNQPSPERIVLLERLSAHIGGVTPHFWAACQICDLNALEAFLRLDAGMVRGIDVQCRQMIQHWGSSPGAQSRPQTPRVSSTPQTPTLPPSTSSPSTHALSSASKRQKIMASPGTVSRDMTVKKQAGERDNFKCVLTGIRLIDVAHIYPYSSMKQREEDRGAPRHAFWDTLRQFWSKEKITIWQNRLFPQGIGETGRDEVYNLISMAPTLHRLWGRGLFALKPISESKDKKSLQVQFFWQAKQADLFTRTNLTTTPVSTEGLQETAGVWLFDADGKKIKSGDHFTLLTDNPLEKPLPDFELLEMQWFLHRIQGMAGAADINWPCLSDDGSDISEISDMDLPALEYSEKDSPLFFSRRLSSLTNLELHGISNLPLLERSKYQEVGEEAREQIGWEHLG